MSANEKKQKNQIVIKEFDEERLAEELGEVIRKNDLENYTKGKVGFFSYSFVFSCCAIFSFILLISS